ncbi:MAG TPA: uridine kinase [Patescibacteria group bacterium]|nr:uridine kinase [Patescibacteria group bacterium]
MEQNTVIVVAGGTASGKTTLANILRKLLGESECALISEDWYYHDRPELTLEERQKLNYDHPTALDFDLMRSHIHDLQNGQPVKTPRYDFKTHSRFSSGWVELTPRPIIIVEGILVLWEKNIREMAKFKFFVDTADDVRLLRRMSRDIRERGRTFEGVKEQWQKTVQPMYHEFCLPSKRYADMIIPEGGENPAVHTILERGLKRLAGVEESTSGTRGFKS